MKSTILKDLMAVVWKHLGKGKPERRKLVAFLCGMETDDITILNPNSARRIVEGDTKNVASKKLYEKQHWDWEKLLNGEVDCWKEKRGKIDKITKDIHAIYMRNIEAGYMILPKDIESDLDTMLHALMVSYVFSCLNTEEYTPVMEPPKIYTCENLIERKRELSCIKDALKSYGKVVVYGMPGIGKSQLVRDFIQKNRKNYHEVYLAEFLGSFEKTIAEIGFQSYHEESSKNESAVYKEKMKFLRNKNKGCLLVLDGIDNGREELEYILGVLGAFHMDVIVVTSQNCSSADGFGQDSRFSCIKVGKMDNDRLFQLFKSNVGSDKRKLDKEELDKLFRILENHTLSICMAARILRKEKQSVSWMTGKIEGSLTIDISDEKFKLPYENKQLTVRGHIKKLIHMQCKSDENMPALKVLSMTARYKTDEEILIRWGAGKVTKEKLRKAVSFCLMESESHTYKMHGIIAEAVEELGKVCLPDMEENIKLIREDIRPGHLCRFNILMAENVLLTVSMRLNGMVEKEFKNKRYSKERIRLWRQFVVESILFLMAYGNTSCSKQIIKVIISADKKDKIVSLLEIVFLYRCAVLEGDVKGSDGMENEIQVYLKSFLLKQEQIDDFYGLILIYFCDHAREVMDRMKYDLLNNGYIRLEWATGFMSLLGELNNINEQINTREFQKKQQCMYISSSVIYYYTEYIDCCRSFMLTAAGGCFKVEQKKLDNRQGSRCIMSLQIEMEELYFSLFNLHLLYIEDGISSTEYAEKVESVREYLEEYRGYAGQFPMELGISYHMNMILLNAVSADGEGLIAVLREAGNYFKGLLRLSDNNFIDKWKKVEEEAIKRISSNFYKNNIKKTLE